MTFVILVSSVFSSRIFLILFLVGSILPKTSMVACVLLKKQLKSKWISKSKDYTRSTEELSVIKHYVLVSTLDSIKSNSLHLYMLVRDKRCTLIHSFISSLINPSSKHLMEKIICIVRELRMNMTQSLSFKSLWFRATNKYK